MKKVRDSIYKVKLQKQIHVNLKIDQNNCDILRSCFTDDGYLLLPDFSNKRLKRINLESTKMVKDYIDFQVRPKAVCTVGKDEAVVALENQSLQFVSLGEKMTVTRTLKMNHECCGVAHKDGKLFIGDGGTTLYIYDMKGQEQRKITTDGSGGNIFTNNRQIAVSDTADRVFVADYNNGVVVLDSQGNYLLILSDRNVQCCTGVCTDGENVFVSGLLSKNIVQFGQSYTTFGEVRKIKDPWFLCFDNKRKKLVVVQEDPENMITLLELE